MRDVYGNWVWVDTDAEASDKKRQSTGKSEPAADTKQESAKERNKRQENQISLDWRDYAALIVASLETVLLPIMVIIVLLVVVALLLFH